MQINIEDEDEQRYLEEISIILHRMNQTLERIEGKMSALDDLKTSQANIAKAAADIAAYLKTLAGSIQGGVSAADAEAIAADLNTQATNIETLIPPAPVA